MISVYPSIINSKELFEKNLHMFCLFVLMFYVPVNNFSVMSGRGFLGWISTKQRIKCLAQAHNAVSLWWGLNPQPLNLDSSTLSLGHQAPHIYKINVLNHIYKHTFWTFTLNITRTPHPYPKTIFHSAQYLVKAALLVLLRPPRGSLSSLDPWK